MTKWPFRISWDISLPSGSHLYYREATSLGWLRDFNTWRDYSTSNDDLSCSNHLFGTAISDLLGLADCFVTGPKLVQVGWWRWYIMLLNIYPPWNHPWLARKKWPMAGAIRSSQSVLGVFGHVSVDLRKPSSGRTIALGLLDVLICYALFSSGNQMLNV